MFRLRRRRRGWRSGPARRLPRQKVPTRRKRRTAPTPVAADERVNQILAPVRDEHHLPGLIGAIVTGDRLAAIGARGSPQDRLARADAGHRPGAPRVVHQGDDGDHDRHSDRRGQAVIRHNDPPGFPQGSPRRLHPDFQARDALAAPDAPSGASRQRPLVATLRQDHDRQAPGPARQRCSARLLSSRPGSTYAYSNVGYALAGLMAEQVTGRIVGGLDAPAVVRAAGDGSAGFGSPGTPAASTSRGAITPRETRSSRPGKTTRRRMGPPAPCIAPCPTGPSSPRCTFRGAQGRAAAETGHVPGPAYPSAGHRLRRRLDRSSNAPGPAAAL